MLEQVRDSLSICQAEGYDICSITVKSIDSGEYETLDISNQSKVTKDDSPSDRLCTSLLVKDKFSVSHKAYHELSTTSDLPCLYQVKKLTKSLNSKVNITNCPNNICGVQQSLNKLVLQQLQVFVHKNAEKGIDTPDTIRIKLTGDGTQIGRELKVINFAFTIIDDEKAQSVTGNYS